MPTTSITTGRRSATLYASTPNSKYDPRRSKNEDFWANALRMSTSALQRASSPDSPSNERKERSDPHTDTSIPKRSPGDNKKRPSVIILSSDDEEEQTRPKSKRRGGQPTYLISVDEDSTRKPNATPRQKGSSSTQPLPKRTRTSTHQHAQPSASNTTMSLKQLRDTGKKLAENGSNGSHAAVIVITMIHKKIEDDSMEALYPVTASINSATSNMICWVE